MPALEIDRVASKKKTNSSDRVPARAHLGGPTGDDQNVVATKAAFDDSHMITTMTLARRTRRLQSALLGQSKRDAGVGE